MKREKWLFRGLILLVIIFIIFGIVSTVKKNKEMRLDLNSGFCSISEAQWYQPPSSMVCVGYNSQGSCTTFVPIQDDPYERAYVKCPAGESWYRESAISRVRNLNN